MEGAADPPIDAKSSIVFRCVVLVRYLLGLDPLTSASTSEPPDPAASSSLATTVVRGIFGATAHSREQPALGEFARAADWPSSSRVNPVDVKLPAPRGNLEQTLSVQSK